ncbi:MAG TPA: bi-domain-containing oxidoreductase [Thermoanaerobaculia bacterium]|jgi:polar amino acid transport system substrate-binding protein|nr:bi-domain-containing oxidoreductase [Thermoanaerobaculia bacterium]
MKQVTQKQSDGEVAVCDAPAPVLRPGGVLVQTAFSLVSAGTERAKVELAKRSLAGKARARPEQVRQVFRAFRDQGFQDTYRRVSNRLSALEPLGYSCSGIVTEVGQGVRDLQAGDLVACAGAGYANHAEINFVPMNLCAPIPGRAAHLLEQAAFTTVGSIAMQGVRQSDLRVGETAVVIGLGLIGLITVQILKAAGCTVAGLDPDARRRALAAATGCDAVAASPNELAAIVRQLTTDFGADAVLITAASSSSGPVTTAAQVARDRARVVVVGAVGLDLPRQPFYDKELDLRLSRSYGPGRYDPQYEERGHDYPIGYVRWTERRNMQSFLRLVADEKIDVRPLITHRFSIGDATRAYDLITTNREPYLGVVLDYGSSDVREQGELPPPPVAVTRRAVIKDDRQIIPSPQGQIKIGLIGAGSFAQNVLLPAFKAAGGIQLKSVVTRSGLTSRSVAKRFGFERADADPSAIMDSGDINVVVIATRHDSHASLTAEALRRGKAIFVEKPLAIDAAGLADVMDAYDASAAGVMVGFNRRFAPATIAVKEWFAPVAEPKFITCRVNAGFVPANHWIHDAEAGGGRIIGEGCHFLDLAGFLAGSVPVSIETAALPDGGRYQRDNVVIRIRYADGSLATVAYLANGASGIGKEYVEMFGGGRVATIDDFRRVKLVSPENSKHIGGRFAKQDKGHRGEIAAFLRAVREGLPSPTPFPELVTTTRLSFAALESLQSGRPVNV